MNQQNNSSEERIEILEGLLWAINERVEVMLVVGMAEDRPDASSRLMKIHRLTKIQADYVLDMPVGRVTKSERDELKRDLEVLKGSL